MKFLFINKILIIIQMMTIILNFNLIFSNKTELFSETEKNIIKSENKNSNKYKESKLFYKQI